MVDVVSNYQKNHRLKKGLSNVENINNNECCKRCLVRYLHLAYINPARIRKDVKDFARKLDFKDKKCLVKIGDNHKSEKIHVIGYENKKKNIQIMCQKNKLIYERRRQITLCSYQRF